MAYTITEPTNNYLPSENMAWFKADSTDKNQNSFVYRYRLQVADPQVAFGIGPTAADVIGTFRIPPKPVSGIGEFSPMSVVKTYTTTPLEYPVGVTAGVTSDGVRKFRLIYGQEYVTTTGATGMDSATGSTYYSWNSIILDEDYPSYNENTYVIQNYASDTSTQLLTDGPNQRCPLDYDLLYAVVGSDTFDDHRARTDLINGNEGQYQTPANVAVWTQVKPSAAGSSDASWLWTAVGGAGALGSSAVTLNKFSMIMTYNRVSTYGPTYKLGPVYPLDKTKIELDTNNASGSLGLINELWLFGLDLAGNWVPVVKFDETTHAGFVRFRLQNYTFTNTYQQIGFAYKYIGFTTRPTIRVVTDWTITTHNPLYWEVDPVGATLPSRHGIGITAGEVVMTYLNSGLTGVLTAGQQSDIYLVNGIGTRLSEIITYSDDYCDNCSGCDKVQLVWLNSLGGYDNYEFNCLNAKELEVSRVVGERTLTPGYVKGQRGRLNTFNVAKRNKSVNTNFTDESIITWLESLFMSPDVYEVQSDGSLIPIIVDSNSYSQWVRPDKIKVATFNYSLAYNRKSQSL